MKMWLKSNTLPSAPAIVEWRRRDLGRFGNKVFSWLLGAFVFGILTSIFFLAVGLPDTAQPAARVVFFAVLIAGLISSAFHCLIKGLWYQITPGGIVHVHPYFGWQERIEEKGTRFFKPHFYSLPWEQVKEIREHKNGLLLILSEDDQTFVPVEPTIKLTMDLSRNRPEAPQKSRAQNDRPSFQKEALRIVIKAAREAHKAAGR